MTTYPSVGDYTSALQHPAVVFSNPGLKKAQFTQGFGGPFCASGTSAVVFQARIGDKLQALRCYLRDDAATPERYAALDRFIAGSRLDQFVGTVTWYREEVKVNGARWPVLEMDWIEGQHLNNYAGFLAEAQDTAALEALAGRWLAMVNELQGALFAHGDLQHGNVIVDTRRRLRLVDFDSVWLPQLRGQAPPTENGHSNFQPPALTVDGRWGPYMDTFAGLAVYLALTVLSKRPQLWEEFNSGDNILFERSDFVPPHDTAVWRSIAAIGDPAVSRLADQVKECCVPGWRPSKTLAETLAYKPRWWENGGQAAGRPTGSPASGPAPAAPGPRASNPPPPVPGPTSALPTLPTSSYQSPVARQAGGAKPGAAPAGPSGPFPSRPAAPRTPGQWWASQPGQAASPPSQGGWQTLPLPTVPAQPPVTQSAPSPSRAQSTKPPAPPAPRPARAPRPRRPAGRMRRIRQRAFLVAGWFFIVLGLVSFIALAADHDPGGGAVDGIVLVLIGLLLRRFRR